MSRRLAFVLLLAAASPASGQVLTGGSSAPDPAGGRPESTRVGPMEFLESAGEAFVGLFRRGDEHGPENPEWDGNAGPREAVMTFAEAAEQAAMGHPLTAWGRRAKLVPPDTAAGFETYRGLGDLFARLPDLSPASIPSATEADAASSPLGCWRRGCENRRTGRPTTGAGWRSSAGTSSARC